MSPAGKGGRIKIKGTPAGVKNLLSGTPGSSGAMVNSGSPPSRETRNKVKVDASPSAVPRRVSRGARSVSRASQAVASEPSSFGQPFGM